MERNRGNKRVKEIMRTLVKILFDVALIATGIYMFCNLYMRIDRLVEQNWSNGMIQSFFQLVILFIVLFLGWFIKSMGSKMQNLRQKRLQQQTEETLARAYKTIEKLNATISMYRILDVQSGAWSFHMFDPFLEEIKSRHIYTIGIVKVQCYTDEAVSELSSRSKYLLGTDILRFGLPDRTFLYLFVETSPDDMRKLMESVLPKDAKIQKTVIHDTLLDTVDETKKNLGIDAEGRYV